MREIKLLMDHEHAGKSYKAGETIEVDEATYDWLMDVYFEKRKQLVAKIQRADKIMKATKK